VELGKEQQMLTSNFIGSMLVITQQMPIKFLSTLVMAQQVLLIQISLVLMLVKTQQVPNFVNWYKPSGAESSNFFGQMLVI
jgi:hypothetical protein